MTTNQELPIDVAREIARQAEVRLMNMMTLAIAQDNRATTLCGILGAISIGLSAAVLAYLGTEHHHIKLVASGAVTAGLFLLAAIAAAYAGAPQDFWIAGGMPRDLRDWSWDGQQWRTEAELLDATAQRLADSIDESRMVLERQSARVKLAMGLAAAALAIGLLVYAVAPTS